MREITVTYSILDEEEERLKKIAEEYKKQHGLDVSEDELFESIMRNGSKYDMERKFAFHEWTLGLRKEL